MLNAALPKSQKPYLISNTLLCAFFLVLLMSLYNLMQYERNYLSKVAWCYGILATCQSSKAPASVVSLCKLTARLPLMQLHCRVAAFSLSFCGCCIYIGLFLFVVSTLFGQQFGNHKFIKTTAVPCLPARQYLVRHARSAGCSASNLDSDRVSFRLMEWVDGWVVPGVRFAWIGLGASLPLINKRRHSFGSL